MNTNADIVVKQEHDNEGDDHYDSHIPTTTTTTTTTNIIRINNSEKENVVGAKTSSNTTTSAKITIAPTIITTSVRVLNIPPQSDQPESIEGEEDGSAGSVCIKEESIEGDEFVIYELEEEAEAENQKSSIIPAAASTLTAPPTTKLKETASAIATPSTPPPPSNPPQPPPPKPPQQKITLTLPPQISLSSISKIKLPPASSLQSPITTATANLSKSSIKKIINLKIRKRLNLPEDSTTTLSKLRILEEAGLSSPSSPSPSPSTSTSSSLLPPKLPQSSFTQLKQTTKATTEGLKVKCHCQLTNSTTNKTATTTSDLENLKSFFEQMFDETRRLSRQDQREVKMMLLEAVSEAEEHFEAGRNCEKCCTKF